VLHSCAAVGCFWSEAILRKADSLCFSRVYLHCFYLCKRCGETVTQKCFADRPSASWQVTESSLKKKNNKIKLHASQAFVEVSTIAALILA